MELFEQSHHLETGEQQWWLEMLWKVIQISRIPPSWVSYSDTMMYHTLWRVY